MFLARLVMGEETNDCVTITALREIAFCLIYEGPMTHTTDLLTYGL